MLAPVITNTNRDILLLLLLLLLLRLHMQRTLSRTVHTPPPLLLSHDIDHAAAAAVTSVTALRSSPTDVSATPIRPLLILHGLFGSKQNWRSISKALSRRLGTDVIPIDLRNHGDSPHSVEHTFQAMANDVEFLCDKLGLEAVNLAGHSM